jgi:integrase
MALTKKAIARSMRGKNLYRCTVTRLKGPEAIPHLKVGKYVKFKIDNNLVNRYFHPALEKAEIDRIRWHDLRHTKASLMLEQKENLKYIQTQLGHSSPTVTLNVCAHLMKPENEEAACRLENTIFKPTCSKIVAES